MKVRSLVILLCLLMALIPAYYINKYLQRSMRPRDSAGRLFLFLLLNLVLVLVYTLLLVGVIVRLFPLH